MKLYIWQQVLIDYTSGMITALAPSLDAALSEARQSNVLSLGDVVAAEMGRVEPEVVELGEVTAQTRVWAVYGGA